VGGGVALGFGVGVGVGEGDLVRLYFIWPNAVEAMKVVVIVAIVIPLIIKRSCFGSLTSRKIFGFALNCKAKILGQVPLENIRRGTVFG
jgi:hypothetical protein